MPCYKFLLWKNRLVTLRRLLGLCTRFLWSYYLSIPFTIHIQWCCCSSSTHKARFLQNIYCIFMEEQRERMFFAKWRPAEKRVTCRFFSCRADKKLTLVNVSEKTNSTCIHTRTHIVIRTIIVLRVMYVCMYVHFLRPPANSSLISNWQFFAGTLPSLGTWTCYVCVYCIVYPYSKVSIFVPSSFASLKLAYFSHFLSFLCSCEISIPSHLHTRMMAHIHIFVCVRMKAYERNQQH